MTDSSFDSAFTKHPNTRIVSAFFSGIVFWGSLCDLLQSPFAQYIGRRIVQRTTAFWERRKVIQSDADRETQVFSETKAAPQSPGKPGLSLPNDPIFRRQDNPALIFVMTLLFCLASIAQFISSLVFTVTFSTSGDQPISPRDEAFCAFLIAWGSTSFQVARLIGLAVLGLNFHSLGIRRMEAIVFWLLAGGIAVPIIVSNALGIGTLNAMAISQNTLMAPVGKTMALCYRRHNLVSSLVLSLMAIALEVYSIVGFLNLISPPSFPLYRKLCTLFRDVRIVRACSLLVFDFVTLVPNAISTTFLGDTLPFSIAALIVLAAFNNYHPPLPVHHVVAPQSIASTQDGRSRGQALQYKSIILTPHPYSAVALAANASRLDVRRGETYFGFPTTSGSDHALLKQTVESSTYNPPKASIPERPAMPSVPQEKSDAYSRSQSSSKGRPRRNSRKTQASGQSQKSQKSQLLYPIVPKAELARQFDDNEQRLRPQDLVPPPPSKVHSKMYSAPERSPPPMLSSRSSGKTKRHSGATSAAQTFTTASVRYGSDILRPEPGYSVRDRMRVQPDTRAQSRASAQTRTVGDSQYAVSVQLQAPTRSPSEDSWTSDMILDAYTYSRFASPSPSSPSMHTLNSAVWPIPPSSMPVVNTIEEDRHQVQVAKTTSSETVQRSTEVLRSNIDQRPEQSAVAGRTGTSNPRRPRGSLVRGPRMQRTPSRTSSMRLEIPSRTNTSNSERSRSPRGPRMQFPPLRSRNTRARQ